MRFHSSKFLLLTLLTATFFSFCPAVFAEWETGIKGGFDTNVNRSLTDEESDSYLTAYLSYIRVPARETNMDWTLILHLEGSAFAKSSDLNYGMAMLAPGIVFNLHPKWRFQIAPFIQAKSVSDSDQSAVAFGGKLGMKQLWNQTYYSGQYIMYTDSSADIDVYSFEETTAGLFLGINWTKAFFTEIGYEYADSDSFRSIGTVSTIPIGQGKSRHYSQAFSQYVISEPVNRHTLGINVGYEFSQFLFSMLTYTYSSYSGDSGDSEAHAVSLGFGYRF